ncbi:MAG: EF-hand domain-containing protein [Candidatus Poseidoniaceae archaeon]
MAALVVVMAVLAMVLMNRKTWAKEPHPALRMTGTFGEGQYTVLTPSAEPGVQVAQSKDECLDLQEEEQYEAELTEKFNALDRNGDGRIRASELRGAYGAEHAEALIEEADVNGDGRLDYTEFAEDDAINGDCGQAD